MKVVVITPFYKMIEVLPALVYCNLISQTYKDMEYWIGDDTSPNFDEGIKLLEARGLLKIPRLNIFRLEERKPWGLGDIFNIVAYQTHCDLLLFVCADNLFLPNYVEQHVKIHQNRQNIALEGSSFSIDMADELQVLKDPSILPTIKLQNSHRLPHDYDDEYCCPDPGPCNQCTFLPHGGSIRRSHFSQVGGFRPEFAGTYSHFDLDLMTRLACIKVYPKRSKLPIAIALGIPGGHGEVRGMSKEAERFPEEHGALLRAFNFGRPDNYINYNRSCRKFKMIVRNGEKIR